MRVAIHIAEDGQCVDAIYWPLSTTRQILGCHSLIKIAEKQKYTVKRIRERNSGDTHACTKDVLFKCIDSEAKKGTIPVPEVIDVIKSYIERCDGLLKHEVEFWLKQGKYSAPQDVEMLDGDLIDIIELEYRTIKQYTIERYNGSIEKRSSTSKQKRRSSPSPEPTPKRGRDCTSHEPATAVNQRISDDDDELLDICSKRRKVYEKGDASDNTCQSLEEQDANKKKTELLKFFESSSDEDLIDMMKVPTEDLPLVEEMPYEPNEDLQRIIDEKKREYNRIFHLRQQAEESKKVLDKHIEVFERELKRIQVYMGRLEAIEEDYFRIQFNH